MVQVIYVGVNGAGRIGKLSTWQLFELDRINKAAGIIGPRVIVRAINDVVPIDQTVASYQKKDQTHGELGWNVEKLGNDRISINGEEVLVFNKGDPSSIPWFHNQQKLTSLWRWVSTMNCISHLIQ
ncbi:hypothetical protein HYU13_05875 [Candidatus Woesearchaeota archaeon]|nr:hypothetical protein [Candidatus Woesearchaeota archaeon]